MDSAQCVLLAEGFVVVEREPARDAPLPRGGAAMDVSEVRPRQTVRRRALHLRIQTETEALRANCIVWWCSSSIITVLIIYDDVRFRFVR